MRLHRDVPPLPLTLPAPSRQAGSLSGAKPKRGRAKLPRAARLAAAGDGDLALYRSLNAAEHRFFGESGIETIVGAILEMPMGSGSPSPSPLDWRSALGIRNPMG
jgi:hypothetical protein